MTIYGERRGEVVRTTGGDTLVLEKDKGVFFTAKLKNGLLEKIRKIFKKKEENKRVLRKTILSSVIEAYNSKYKTKYQDIEEVPVSFTISKILNIVASKDLVSLTGEQDAMGMKKVIVQRVGIEDIRKDLKIIYPRAARVIGVIMDAPPKEIKKLYELLGKKQIDLIKDMRASARQKSPRTINMEDMEQVEELFTITESLLAKRK